MSEKIDLNQYEGLLLKIVKENPGLSDRKATELSGLPKETTAKYLKRLHEYGLVECQRLQQNEKAWFVSVKIFLDFETLRKRVMEDYDIMESKIRKSLKLVENRPDNEIVSVYRSAYKKIFAYRDFIAFITSTNNFRKHPKNWLELQAKIDKFLKELAKGVNDSIYVHVTEDLYQRDSEALDEIDYFLQVQGKHSNFEESNPLKE